jgi:hypothetical protein
MLKQHSNLLPASTITIELACDLFEFSVAERLPRIASIALFVDHGHVVKNWKRQSGKSGIGNGAF